MVEPRVAVGRTARVAAHVFRRRWERLANTAHEVAELRKLQHEIARAYVDAQRRFITLQSEMLALLRANSSDIGDRQTSAFAEYDDTGMLYDLMVLVTARLRALERRRAGFVFTF